MKTTIETITPQQAQKYLERNTTNRPLRVRTVEDYARDMTRGNWVLNHQPIGFDTDGNLIDGQHRLHAVVESKTPTQFNVTRGVPAAAKQNGVMIHTMDTVDRGKMRTVGDQLVLRHGYKNGALVAACARHIARMITSTVQSVSTPVALEILKIYGKDVSFVVEHRSSMPGLRRAAFLGSMAIARHAKPQEMEAFYTAVVSGEGLKKTQPAFTLREYLLRTTDIVGDQVAFRAGAITLNCAKHYIDGDSMRCIKLTSLGINYFLSLQKSAVNAVAKLFQKPE